MMPRFEPPASCESHKPVILGNTLKTQKIMQLPSAQDWPTDYESRVNFGNLESNIKFLNCTGVLNEGAKILEIGSGRGAFLHHLRTSGYDAVGVDINAQYIQEGAAIFGELPIRLIEGVDLPFDDNQFDIVMSFDLFEHIRDSDAHLREVSRVLKEGGIYLLQTPNQCTNFIFAILIRRRQYADWHSEHCSLHNYWSAKKRFRRHDFDISFYDIPVANDFFKMKLRHFAGPMALPLLRVFNPDNFPLFLRTNFYIKAQKQ